METAEEHISNTTRWKRLESTLPIRYSAEPTQARFHASDAIVKGIMGPFGTGKTAACVIDIILRALQKPEYRGVRRSRWGVIRNTYPELKSTTIKTWTEWLNEDICPINWGSPITARMKRRDIGLDLEVLFVSVDRPADVNKLMSLELGGGIWLNEARFLPKAVLDAALGRTARYNKQLFGEMIWSGVIMDTNPPDNDHWWYSLAEEEKPIGYQFFRQPPAVVVVGDHYEPNYGQTGLAPAEGVQYQPLGFEYWMRQIPGKKKEWIKVFLQGEYGFTSEGKPVYPEFSDRVHVSQTPIEPMRGLPLIVGWDWGLTPACAFVQVTPRGQARAIDELVAYDMGIEQFGRDVVKPHIANKYHDMEIFHYGEPSGKDRRDNEAKSAIDTLAEKVGIFVLPSRSREPATCQSAVRGFLIKMVDGGPGFLLDSKCRVLHKGFLGAYMLERLQVIGEDRYRDHPKKNIYSHVHEALQAALLSHHLIDKHHQQRMEAWVADERIHDQAAGYA